MARKKMLGLLLAAALTGAGPARATPQHGRHAPVVRHPARHPGHRHAAAPAQPYASRILPTPTCRYPDGTPYDPDIIGGANHVGDGGPAANLGGFNPCGY